MLVRSNWERKTEVRLDRDDDVSTGLRVDPFAVACKGAGFARDFRLVVPDLAKKGVEDLKMLAG